MKLLISSHVFYSEILNVNIFYFPVFFSGFFLFYFNRTCICDGDSSFAVQFVPRENSHETEMCS